MKKRLTYNLKDSGLNFIYSVLFPQVTAFVLLLIVTVGSYSSGVELMDSIGDGFVYYLFLSSSQLTFLLIYMLYNNNKEINFVKASKLDKKINLKQIGVLVLISLTTLYFLNPLIGLVDYLFSLIGYAPSGEIGLNLESFGGFLAGAFCLAVLPAVFEELLFRGIIYNGMQKLGHKKAIIYSALIFALMHGSLQQTVYQFILGVVLAYVVYITGTLRASMLIHFLNNFIVIFISYMVASEGNVVATSEFSSAQDFILPVLYSFVAFFAIKHLLLWLKKVTPESEEVDKAILEQPIEVEQYEFQTDEFQQQTVEAEQVESDLNAKGLFVTGAIIGLSLWLLDLVIVLLS